MGDERMDRIWSLRLYPVPRSSPQKHCQLGGMGRRHATRQPTKVYRGGSFEFSEFAQDAVLFGLRMNQGISIPTIAKNFDVSIDQFLELLNF